MLKQFDIIASLKQTTGSKKMTKTQGIYPESNGTFLVMTFTKSWSYKTEKAANKKWASLVKADLV